MAEAELAIQRHVLGTGLLDVSSPESFWTWLHERWLPQLQQHRHSFPPSGVLIYDAFQRPVVGAYGNSYIALPRPLGDESAQNSSAALWGVGMVLRQHRVLMTNCSSRMAHVDRFTPAANMDPAADIEPGSGECYEKVQVSPSDSWKLTQYTTAIRSKFTIAECAQGCSRFGAAGCTAFLHSDGDGFLAAQFTDAGVSGATVLDDHPLLATSKVIEAARSWRQDSCFMAAEEKQPLDCNASFVEDAQNVPPRGQACAKGVKMTAYRPGACPPGAHLCSPPFSDLTKDTNSEAWGGREGFGFRAGGGGWNRRREDSIVEDREDGDARQHRALYGSTNKSSVSANSTGGAGDFEVARYGDPWSYTEGPGRLWGGPWSGTGAVVGRMAVYPGGGYGVDLLQKGGVGGRVAELQRRGWIDRATRAVSMDLWVVLPAGGHATRVSILFELPAGGRWMPSLRMRSGPLPGAALKAAAAADAQDALRPSGGVRAGSVARGVGNWFAMEVVMLLLQVVHSSPLSVVCPRQPLLATSLSRSL